MKRARLTVLAESASGHCLVILSLAYPVSHFDFLHFSLIKAELSQRLVNLDRTTNYLYQTKDAAIMYGSSKRSTIMPPLSFQPHAYTRTHAHTRVYTERNN